MKKTLPHEDGERATCASLTDRRRRIVGNYELGAILAIGDFDCYTRLCTYIPTGVSYVARIYNKALLAETPWMWERVRESVHVQCSLPEHVNLIKMIECFETTKSLYIIMTMFSSVTVVKLFVGPFTSLPSGKAGIPVSCTGRPEAKEKQLVGSNITSKGIRKNSVNDLADTQKGFSNHVKVYNCYNDEEDCQASYERNCFAPSLRAKPINGVLSYNEGKTEHISTLISELDPRIRMLGDTQAGAEKAGTHLQSFPPKARKTCASHNPATVLVATPLSSLENSKSVSVMDISTDSDDALECSVGSLCGSVDYHLVWHIFISVVHGILHLHRHGVVHGGIAPDHVLYNTDHGTVRISNMISCYRCERGTKRTELRGTRHTVAPEVLKQEPYDPYLADAWSLGVLLYFMLDGGRYPHDGANTLKHILYHQIRPLKVKKKKASGVDLVRHLLQPNPTERLTVEAILYHPFCCRTSQCATSSFFRRANDDDDESGSRKDPWGDSWHLMEKNESSALLTVAHGASSGTCASMPTPTSSEKSSDYNLCHYDKHLAPSNVSVSSRGRRSLSTLRNATNSVVRTEQTTTLTSLASIEHAPQRPGSRRAERFWFRLDERGAQAAVVIQRCYRDYQRRKNFRRITHALLEKSNIPAASPRIGTTERYALSRCRPPSAGPRRYKAQAMPKPSFSVPPTQTAQTSTPSEFCLKEMPILEESGLSPVISPSRSQKSDKLSSMCANQPVEALVVQANDADERRECTHGIVKAEQKCKVLPRPQAFTGSWLKNHRQESLMPEIKLPLITPKYLSIALKTSVSPASDIFPSRHTKPHDSNSNGTKPICGTRTGALPTSLKFLDKYSFTNASSLRMLADQSRKTLPPLGSRPYANTKYEYKNGVFSLMRAT